MFNSISLPSANRRPVERLRHLHGTLEHGYTLVEVSVVVAIVALLIALAGPSIGAFRAKQQLRTVTDSIFSSLLFTRQEAIMRNVRVVMCKSGDGKQCVKTGGWEQGWIVFQDLNNNATVDIADTVLLRQSGDRMAKITSKTTISNYVSYTGLGVSAHTSGAFQSGTMTVCLPSKFPVELRNIVVSPGGRARVNVLAAGPCG